MTLQARLIPHSPRREKDRAPKTPRSAKRMEMGYLRWLVRTRDRERPNPLDSKATASNVIMATVTTPSSTWNWETKDQTTWPPKVFVMTLNVLGEGGLKNK